MRTRLVRNLFTHTWLAFRPRTIRSHHPPPHRNLSFYQSVSMSEYGAEPMAVEAPTLDTNPIENAAHAPHVSLDISDTAKRRKGVVESDEDDDEVPLSKKPKVTNGSPVKSRKAKRKTVIESDSESAMSEDNAGAQSSDSDDDAPLAAKAAMSKPKSNGSAPSSSKPRASTSKPKPTPPSASEQESDLSQGSEDDKPLKAKSKPKAKVKAKVESESDDDKPLIKKRAPAKGKGRKAESGSEDDDDKPLVNKSVKVEKKKPAPKVKAEVKPSAAVKKGKGAKEEEDEDRYKWWAEEAEGDGSVKWTTFEHNGVLFPPPYVPLPKGVRMKYNGKSLTLPPESEEVAGFFAAMIETDHAKDKVFRENFFRDFKKILEEFPPADGTRVEDLELCDFRPMYEHFEAEKDKKKQMSKEEKKQIKEERDAMEKKYITCLVDGRVEKVGNFRAEPPGLFRGRGDHPRKGTLKYRLRPEDIVLNIGQNAPVPVPNIEGEWKKVQHDNTVTWLAHWKENVNGQAKYVFLSAGSSWKGQSDRAKFEKARELIKHVDKIRKDYTADLKSKVMADRQRATALYFIDVLALRAGNEKGEDEADTVGCCSLRYEHVTLLPPDIVKFDFLGKDSMRFQQEVKVTPQVFKNIKIFKSEPKKEGDDLFDRLTTTSLNKHLNSYMKGLTAKVFRTYNASWTFQNQLRNTPKDGSVAEKIAAYQTANREVAILCNHQKTVSKGFSETLGKLKDKVTALKYQRMRLRLQLFDLDPKEKKRHPELVDDESDLDDEFMDRHEEELLEKAIDGARKKFERDNVKAEEDGKVEAKPADWLDGKIKELEKENKQMRKERVKGKIEAGNGMTVEKILKKIETLDGRIQTLKVNNRVRDENKEVALGTSKINYIDPRLTVAWAKKYDVPLEKLFSKTLREKFPWAIEEADAKWQF